jgi:hypothetical protein
LSGNGLLSYPSRCEKIALRVLDLPPAAWQCKILMEPDVATAPFGE